MRANAPSFQPAASPAPALASDDSLCDSLLTALVTEKEQHCAARVALEASQAQITSLSNNNKTFKTAKALQEATIRNKRRESTINTTHKSILCDVLAEQREIYETKGHPEYISDNSISDDELFDLSFVKSQEEFSDEERKIFRQFLNKEDATTSSPPKDTIEVKRGLNFLVKVTPLSYNVFSAKSPDKHKTTPPMVAEALQSCHPALDSVVKMSRAPANLEKPPTLQLPAEFLSKYRPAMRTPVVELEPKIDNQSSAEQEVNTNTKGTQEDVIDANVATPSALTKATRDYAIDVKGGLPTAILDTNIRWAMSSLAPAFEDDEEKLGAKGGMANTKQGSYFWEHVVRYLPNPTEKNLYRTIMIDYIPHGATYQDVLQHVRTGAVESIQMFPPLRASTNYWTARVVFTYELPAVSMIMHHQKRLHQGAPIKIRGTPVRVWQVLQPTYPANKLVETDIFQHGYSRILLLENVEDSGVLPKLHKKLATEMRNDTVIEINRTADGVPMVEFTSVAVAAGAMRRLEGDREFKGCIFDFDRDYCEDGYPNN